MIATLAPDFGVVGFLAIEMRSIPYNLAKLASKFPQEIRIDEEGVTHQGHRESLSVFNG